MCWNKMKENWIEKLIELLNEYEEEISKKEKSVAVYWTNRLWILQYGSYIQQLSISYMISNHYWFIKWLVENDKIDTQNLITYMNWTSLTFNKVPSTDCAGIDKIWNKFYTEVLLMLLAISDTPIEALISYLKWEITTIEDWPITYRKDSNWKLVADREPPIVLC